MAGRVLEFGERLADQDPAQLTIPAARAAYEAVSDHPDFSVRELRRLNDVGGESEILVVDCACDRVWSRNPFGIQYREPIALRFYLDPKRMPEARMLREDFPALLHTNHVAAGEPKWLCLYFEPWASVARTWTAQKFLARIQWWLVESANGTLHAIDQPPEQVFFDTGITIVVPEDFDQRIGAKDQGLVLSGPDRQPGARWVLRAQFRPIVDYARIGASQYACVALSLPSIPHAPVREPPDTLGGLHDLLEASGAPLSEALFKEVQRIAEGSGLPKVSSQKTLLLLVLTVFNPAGGQQRTEYRGFILQAPLGELGVIAGVLVEQNGKYFRAVTLGGMKLESGWRLVSIQPVELGEPFSPANARRYSGIESAGEPSVLCGVGALGSALADVWAREGWRAWTYADPDILMPHNLARHRGYGNQVGLPKVDVVRQLEAALFPSRPVVAGIRAAANDADPEIVAVLRAATLIVDATTTIDVPRDLAQRDELARLASVFLTPYGNDSVLLLEDQARALRLDTLEAQYYRFLLNSDWGRIHLRGHGGRLWVGAGCRDISNVMSWEMVQLHASLLARQVRLRTATSDPLIQVWRADPDTGAIQTLAVATNLSRGVDLDEMKLVWDEGLRSKIRAMREVALPNETGGVLLGYFDLPTKQVFVVDALPAPSDSQEAHVEFTRGVEGLEAQVEDAKERTAGIVGYIGEWHSHPRGVAPDPSMLDIRLLVHLALVLRQDGHPALMLIVGEEDEQWMIANVRN